MIKPTEARQRSLINVTMFFAWKGLMAVIKRSMERIGSFRLRLGVRGKTRYEPFSIYLKFDPSKGFEKAEDPPDPDEETLKMIHDFHCEIQKGEEDRPPNQSDIASMVNDHGMNRKRASKNSKEGRRAISSKSYPIPM